MKAISIRGKRQRSNADCLIRELARPEIVCWLSASKETLLVHPSYQEQIEQWVRYQTLAAGTVLTLRRWRNDCECSPDAPLGAKGHCKGHDEIRVVDPAEAGKPFTWFINGWRRDHGVDVITVYAFGVRIGSKGR